MAESAIQKIIAKVIKIKYHINVFVAKMISSPTDKGGIFFCFNYNFYIKNSEIYCKKKRSNSLSYL